MAYDSDFTAQTVWNFDNERYKTIHYFLVVAETQFMRWDLENLYWTLRSLKRMISPKVKETELTKVNNDLKDLENLRKMFLKAPHNYGSKLFNKSEEFYELLVLLMKKHGMFFREGDDVRRAIVD